eukprot:CAMPEP_0113499090 /NCGR_PEP_ID=MMETSP0014_2-20120614/31551_1 /TAXON_ID=2857 /ORGANISM="Nitzschia sp." /LENGTH=117 /DNA_ID=CAMNT_0000393219 /DNA_START=43 /DNA_END=393 /DNA_ORIENTATION=+ /assembly_acc=CAM_ASM_000159
MNNRRPSLIDQMAMAAALEGIGDSEDDDDDDNDDDSSDIDYDDDDDGRRLFDDDIEEGDEEEDDDDDDLNEDDDDRIVGGDGRSENELILDYDLPAEDDFDDEVTNVVLLQNRISSP